MKNKEIKLSNGGYIGKNMVNKPYEFFEIKQKVNNPYELFAIKQKEIKLSRKWNESYKRR